MGVSCSADRNIKAKINKEGIWIEKLEDNPTRLIPESMREAGEGGDVECVVDGVACDVDGADPAGGDRGVGCVCRHEVFVGDVRLKGAQL